MGDYTYRPFAKPGFENLVTVRDFKVSRTYYKDIRIAEELIYYFNLLRVKKKMVIPAITKLKTIQKNLYALLTKIL